MSIIDNTYQQLTNYPDVLSIEDLQHVLKIGRNSAYTLLKNNTIKTIKIGKKYIIPKKSIINFLNQDIA